MDILWKIYEHAGQVFPHQLLISWLKDYKRPNDKIKSLKDKGVLVPLKRGIYIVGPTVTNTKPNLLVVANQLLGPSYVSFEAALSYHGFIPERVYGISSMVTKASRSFDTPLGLFSYTRLPLPYYSYGFSSVQLSSDQHVVIASKEKALCDKIITTKGLTLRSVDGAYQFLVESLRINGEDLKELNVSMMGSWLAESPKRESLKMVIKLVDKLR